MAIGYFLRVGDITTCNGRILSGDNTFRWYGVAGAREGDVVTCGKHAGAYQIVGGVSNMWDKNRRLAGSLDSFSSCPCHSRFIPSIKDSYVKEAASVASALTAAIPSLFSHHFTLQNPKNSRLSESVAYGVKTASALIEGVSTQGDIADSMESQREERVEVAYLFQTRMGIKK